MVRHVGPWALVAVLVLGSVAPAVVAPVARADTESPAATPGTPTAQTATPAGPGPETDARNASSDARITALSYEGSGAADVGEEPYLWQSSPHRFAVAVATDGGLANGSVCVRAIQSVERETLGCRSLSLAPNGTATVTIGVGEWPANVTGSQTLEAVVTAGNGSEPLAARNRTVTVVRTGDDPDGDGLPNEREAGLGTSLWSADTDGDGLTDGVEVRTYGTNATNTDSDGDGLTDGAELEVHQTDPAHADADDDGLTDPRELEAGTDPNRGDTDGDGAADSIEVNTYGTNASDPDTDGDGLDDGAEINQYKTNATKPDTDDDGLDDTLEVDTYGTDPNKIDTDGDGLDDGTEVDDHRTDPADDDTDDDGLRDGREVNTYGTNPTNPDTDGDGLDDGPEIQRYETDPTDPDTDDDGRGDAAAVEESSLRVTPRTAGVAAAALLVALGGFALWRSNRNPVARVRAAVAGDADRDADAAAGTGDREESAADGDASPDATEPVDDGADGAGTRGVPASAGGGPVSRDAESAVGDPGPEAASLDASDPDEVPPEFLSNEERVLAVLDDHDGRVPQSTLVEETEWSKSKVSRVLSGMEADGDVVKVDVGRGNVVMRPDDLPPGVESPLDE